MAFFTIAFFWQRWALSFLPCPSCIAWTVASVLFVPGSVLCNSNGQALGNAWGFSVMLFSAPQRLYTGFPCLVLYPTIATCFRAFLSHSMGLYSGFILGPFPCVLAGFFRGGIRDIGEGRKTPWRAFYGVLGALYGVVYGMRCPVCLSVCLDPLYAHGQSA